jgi:hypothetical protein
MADGGRFATDACDLTPNYAGMLKADWPACLPDVYPNASPRRLLGPRHRTVQRTR